MIGRKLPVVTVVIIVLCVVIVAGFFGYLAWNWCHQPPRIDDGLGALTHRSKPKPRQLRVPGSPVEAAAMASEATAANEKKMQ